MENLIVIGIVLVVIFLILLGLALVWKKVPQDKALVITGLRKRVLSGGGGLVVPLFERADRISLENVKIEVKIDGALTEQGVDIIADGVAIIKIKSDEESILAATEQFNTGNEIQTIRVIEDISRNVLEGKLREIISKLSVEEIYKDREKFASQVQEVAAIDLSDMGLEIKAFTIRDLSDSNGYLQALGKKRIAEVKRDADIAQAEAAKETKIKTAEATREGEEARLVAETRIAEASKERELKVQTYKKDEQTAKAEADLAYEIKANKVKKEVAETELEVELLRKQRETEIQEQEAARRQKELEATVNKDADADFYKRQKETDAKQYQQIKEAEVKARSVRLQGEAEADAIKLRGNAEAQTKALMVKLQGEAEAEVIRLRGLAEAESMRQKAEAFKMYNDAAVTQMIIDRLPDIAAAISEPLSKTEKIVVIDNGGSPSNRSGAAKISGYVTDIMASLPETVEALTGYDINEALNNFAKTTENHGTKKNDDIPKITSDNPPAEQPSAQ